jgi:hypothetical protein
MTKLKFTKEMQQNTTAAIDKDMIAFAEFYGHFYSSLGVWNGHFHIITSELVASLDLYKKTRIPPLPKYKS